MTKSSPKISLSESQRNVRRTVEVVRLATRGLYRSQLPRMAAALAYRTIFSIIPVLVISLVVLGSFASDQDVKDLLNRVLDFTGMSKVVVTQDQITDGPPAIGEPPSEPSEGSADQADANTENELPSGFQEEQESVDQLIQGLVERVRAIPLTAIGLIGVLILVYAAISMVVEIERAFNQICHAPSGRSWLRRLTQYWTMLTLGAVFLVATFFVGEQFKGMVADLVASGSLGGAGPIILTAIGFLTTVGISTLLFVVLYTTVPNARVGLRNAAAGAIVAAVLWEAGKWGFTQYLSYSASYARFYGSIALIPLFLFWVYLTWLIVLFGLQVSYGLQVFSTWQPKQTGHDDEPAFVDPASILLVMGAVARRFLAGQSADASQVAEEAGLNETITRRMLDQLTDAGLLNRVADGDSDADYALAKPAEHIQALDVLSAGEALAPASTSDATMQRLRAARLDLLKDKPVSELIEQEET